MVRGDVPDGDRYQGHLFETTVLNIFDWYGSREYQHQLSAEELSDICLQLAARRGKILNLDA
jgi:hypothetical protein